MTDQVHNIFFDLGDTIVHRRQWIDGAIPLLIDLKLHGVRIGLLSNTGKLSKDQLLPLLPEDFTYDYFEDQLIILSGEAGFEKPDPRIFNHAINVTGAAAYRSLFVTENLEHSQVAQGLGMRIVRIRPNYGEDLKELLPVLITSGLIHPLQRQLNT